MTEGEMELLWAYERNYITSKVLLECEESRLGGYNESLSEIPFYRFFHKAYLVRSIYTLEHNVRGLKTVVQREHKAYEDYKSKCGDQVAALISDGGRNDY